MLVHRLAPEGFLCVRENPDDTEGRLLFSDPLRDPLGSWELGRRIPLADRVFLAPVAPRKIVGIGRSFVAHARELGNPIPDEPIVFLKSPDSVIGPGAPILRPPESRRVDFEGEIAVVLRARLHRASSQEARDATLGVTAACDVTARDLQRQDATFARAKSFDTFCPLGPGLLVGAPPTELEAVELETRVNGEVRQRASLRELSMPLWELLAWISRTMTLEAGDVVLLGTPEGVGELRHGDRVEVRVPGVGSLENPVEDWNQGPT